MILISTSRPHQFLGLRSESGKQEAENILKNPLQVLLGGKWPWVIEKFATSHQDRNRERLYTE